MPSLLETLTAQLREILQEAVHRLILQGQLPDVPFPPISLRSQSPALPRRKSTPVCGDLSSSFPLAAAGAFRQSPGQLAALLHAQISPAVLVSEGFFSGCSNAPSGHLNFFFSDFFYAQSILGILSVKKSDPKANEEFSGHSFSFADFFESRGSVQPQDPLQLFPRLYPPDCFGQTERSLKKEAEIKLLYFRYTWRRIADILTALSYDGIHPDPATSESLSGVYTRTSERALIRHLAHAPPSLRTSTPENALEYALDLATLFHGFYDRCRIRGQSPSVISGRIHLCHAVQIVLSQCFRLFALPPPG